MSSNLARARTARNCDPLPLFAWALKAHGRRPRQTYAVRHVQRLANLSPSSAALYASLAGLPVEEA